MWKKASENNTIDWSEVIGNAFYKIQGYASDLYIEIYADGSLKYPSGRYDKSLCKLHRRDRSCPKCTPVYSIAGWSVEDDESFCIYDNEGNEKKGMLWDTENDEWMSKEDAISSCVEFYTDEAMQGKYTQPLPCEYMAEMAGKMEVDE